MAVKGSNFFLDHIEKIALVIAGVLCLILLFKGVILTPNAVEYEGRTYTPGEIDKQIEKETEELRHRLADEPAAVGKPPEKLNDYLSRLEQPIELDTSLWPVVPSLTGPDDDGRRYSIPEPPVIKDAAVGRIRALAFFPINEIGGQVTYENVETEPNDLDLVTVEARLDIAGLYDSFRESFEGPSVKLQWQDPCLAKPIFAAVELQRSRKLADGSWSDWQDVPRLKIDSMRPLLKVIERLEDLPRGGMKVRLLQYNNFDVMNNILQPIPYDIASAEEQWYPPSLHEKYLSVMKEQQLAERREELEQARKEREQGQEEARRNRRENRNVAGSAPKGLTKSSAADSESLYKRDKSDQNDREREREELRLRREQEKELERDPDTQLYEALITREKELGEMTEPLLFWSYDETAKPGNTYRYRIRLGVFNPLAGTSKLKSDSESYKDQVILWSNYADAGTLKIPDRLYFFAMDIREAANSVIVEVFRYAMGYWHSKEYVVEAGEAIGRLDSPEEPASTFEPREPGLSQETTVLIPETIDFRTKAVMVDTAAVEDWSGGRNLRPRNYFDMYYSYDGSNIESLPIRQRFWSSDMLGTYNDIRSQMRQPKQPYRARSNVQKIKSPSSLRTKRGAEPASLYKDHNKK